MEEPEILWIQREVWELVEALHKLRHAGNGQRFLVTMPDRVITLAVMDVREVT